MKLTGKEKVSYGLGAVGKDMVYMLSASYILYYYQDILGVSAFAMGVILLAARVFDAFNDPIMGVVVAKTRTRWGKFRPWLLIGTILNAIMLYLMFSAPPALDGGGLVAYAAVTYVLWGVTYTMMDIPYWSMIPAFTEGGKSVRDFPRWRAPVRASALPSSRSSQCYVYTVLAAGMSAWDSSGLHSSLQSYLYFSRRLHVSTSRKNLRSMWILRLWDRCSVH